MPPRSTADFFEVINVTALAIGLYKRNIAEIVNTVGVQSCSFTTLKCRCMHVEKISH